MNKQVICYYHRKDMDGYCSGAIVKKARPDAELRGWDYQDQVPDIQQLKGKIVVFIDITFPIDVLMELGKIADVVVLDHHVSFYRDAENKELTFKYVYHPDLAACEIGWNYFMNKPVPNFVQLIGEYDTWRQSDIHRWSNSVLPFKEFCYSIINSPETFPQEMFSDNFDINSAIKEGKTILRAMKKANEVVSRRAFEKEVYGGYKALCVNHAPFSSDTLESIWDSDKYDLMVGFNYNGNGWSISLRSEGDFDVSKIAKERGGGGHQNASGMEVESFEKIFK